MIKITSDTTADLSQYFAERDIITMPLAVILGNDMFYDGENITPQDIFEYVAKNKKLPKTSARSVDEFVEFFKKVKGEDNEIIHFNISSDLSVNNANAKKAAEIVGNVYVVDSKTLSTGTGLLVLYACDLRDEEKLSAKEIYDKVMKRVPYVEASFIVDTMDYLHKGGRCSGLTHFAASALKLHPELILKDGKIVVGSKYIGNVPKIAPKYVNNILTMFNNPDKKRVFVTHSNATQDVVDIVINTLKENAQFENILVTVAGSTVTSHCGKGTIGILYINDGGVQD